VDQHPLIRHELARERQLDLRSDGAQPRLGRRAKRAAREEARDAAVVAALVRAAAGGDDGAWRSLIDRFTPTIRAAARSFRLAPADIDDVVQNTWLAACRHVHRLQKPEAIGAWLTVTARRESMRIVERGTREFVAEDPPTPVAPEREAPESVLVESERHDALRAAAGRVPGRYGAILAALLHTPGVSYKELSHQLEMPLGSIGPTRERALDCLRRDRRLSDALGES
jgi:RNA polymerase sigma factor (sigma-70 family)